MPTTEAYTMNVPFYYERLLETAGLIARHADFPGKRQLVEQCRRKWRS